MSTQKLVMAGVVTVVIVGGYMALNTENTSDSVAVTGGNQVTTTDRDFVPAGKDSIMKLWKQGKSLKCDISYAAINEDRMEGTVYLDNDRMRGDFSIESEGGAMTTSVIQDGDTGYTWGSTPFGTMAMKFTVTEEGKANQEGMPDFDEDVDYTCEKWRVDEGKFIPPSDITFQEFNPSTPTFEGAPAEPFAVDCSVCDNVPDPAGKAQCRAAIGCE